MSTILTLAWRPFLDPLDLAGVWWLFLLPLALFISLAYKAVRMPDLELPGGVRRYLRATIAMTTQIVVAMILLWIAFYIFVLHLLPAIAPMPGV